MKYNVTKDFEGHTAGEIVDSETSSLTTEQIAELITEGYIEPIMDEALYEDVTVDQAYLDAHPDEVAAGIKVGDVVTRLKTVPVEETDAGVDAAVEGADTTVETEVEGAPVMTYRGLTVVSDGMRIGGEGQEIHSLTLSDGSTTDVTDEEYEEMVKNAVK